MAGNRTWTRAEASPLQEPSPTGVRSVVGEDTLTTHAPVEIATSGEAGLAGLGRGGPSYPAGTPTRAAGDHGLGSCLAQETLIRSPNWRPTSAGRVCALAPREGRSRRARGPVPEVNGFGCDRAPEMGATPVRRSLLSQDGSSPGPSDPASRPRCARHHSAVHQTHPLPSHLRSTSARGHDPTGMPGTPPASPNLPSADRRYQVPRCRAGTARLPSGDRYTQALWCPGWRWRAAFRPKSRRRSGTRRSLNLPRSGGTQSGPLPSATSDVRNAAIGTI